MPRHDRAYGRWFQSGNKGGSVARRARKSRARVRVSTYRLKREDKAK